MSVDKVEPVRRNLEQLENNRYDVLVIGSGIHGACIAWDAALRGLSVALVEKGDFGHATSANTLKIIHGGLRYLQDANLGLVRRMIRERATWMRIAPHLVHPLPCLMPTYSRFGRSKEIMAAALTLNDVISHDRNRHMEPQKHLANGRIISRSECLRQLPGVAAAGITGGALWHDARMHSSERLLLALLLSATKAGAEVANYVEVTGLLGDDTRVTGVRARDLLDDQELEIRAELVINSAGPWVDSVLRSLKSSMASRFRMSIALNLVTRQIHPTHAVAIPSRYMRRDKQGNLTPRTRLLFVVPWCGYSMVGTSHLPYDGPPGNYQVTEETIEGLIGEINTAYPGAALTRTDVHQVQWGFLPAAKNDFQTETVKLVRQAQIHDHAREDSTRGLISVVGVKYTTARHVAQKVVDMAMTKLGRDTSACRTQTMPVYGGRIDGFDGFLAQAIAGRPAGVDPEIMQHLVYSYGTEHTQILKYLDEEPAWGHTVSAASLVLEAEVIHAVREEMAQTLADVVRRRTDLGAASLPDETSLRRCADLMAAELGWDQARVARELDELGAAYTPAMAPTRDKRGTD
ncbi:MAG: glycerol-3-phosphate dehydrogenase/oxidase [Anaerolineae bacterium]|nr:glycerol-3-phosphate dehydrogenase/oxidase [Anaerolineae bacterium]